MKKNIKWILLVITIIALIITIILFINFNNNRSEKNSTIESKIMEIYDKRWLRTGISVYKNNELIGENSVLVDTRYLLFKEEKVSYCNPEEDKCTEYNYVYNEKDNTIYFDSEDYFVVKGTYEITFYEDKFDLTMISEEETIVYHFDTPKG